MRARGWIVVAAVAAVGCGSRPGQDCPPGHARQGAECVAQPACSGSPAACGAICCGAGQTCVAAGECRGRPCSAAAPCDAAQVCRDGHCLGFDPACTYEPPPSPGFAPRVAWAWTGSTTMPEYADVLMTPVVMPLPQLGSSDGWAPPAVVFNSISRNYGAGTEVPGVMRAIRGDGAGEVWTTDATHLVNGLAGIAAGDLLGTGEPVFVTARWSGFDAAQEGLVAFGADGRFLWEVKGIHVQWGAPSIANLDGGKEAKIVIGATVVDAHGRVVCQGQPGTGSNFNGPISVVADVDGDGMPEIVTGNTVYDASCRPKPGWPAHKPSGELWEDGVTAVADFLGNGQAQIAVVSGGPKVNGVSQGTVRIMDAHGNLAWGPVALPGGGAGGAPTVADFDGDGKPEIGVAGFSRYSVLKPFAKDPVLWSTATQDHSDVTGSSVFDFENDGRAEVVYGDECYVRVYDGTTGSVLYQAQNSSCTTYEYPVVADVDRDGRAEIVVPTNSVCNYTCPWGSQYGSGMHGITVLKDLRDQWVGTRSVWNEHAYHVTNVGENGAIPWPEPPNWTTPSLNDFRANPMGASRYAAPNLTAEPSDVSTDTGGCPASLAITVDVWNRGAVPVAAGVPIAFFALPSRQLYGVATTTGSILPGEFEAVTLTVKGPPATPAGVEIHLDDDGTGKGVVSECDEADNVVTASAFCPGSSG